MHGARSACNFGGEADLDGRADGSTRGPTTYEVSHHEWEGCLPITGVNGLHGLLSVPSARKPRFGVFTFEACYSSRLQK